MGKSLASPSPSPYLAPSLPSVVRPTTPSRRSSYLSDLDVLQDDADDHPDGRLRAVSRAVRGWSDLVVAKVEENAGLCLIALSQGLFACMNISVKILQDHGGGMPVLQLIAIRMSITLIGCITWLHRINDPNPFFGPPQVRKMLALRGFIGFFGLSGMYQSLKYLSLSDATTLSFLTPTCTALLGYLFLREPFTRKECAAGLISLLGVLLIARPASLFGSASQSPHQTPITADGISRTPYLSHLSPVEYVPTAGQRLGAVAFALMGVMGSSGAYTAIRAIGTRATPYHSIAYFSFYCVVVAVTGLIMFKTPLVFPHSLSGWFMIFIIGVFGLGAQVLVTMGLQREKAGRGSLAMYTQLLFATILERLIFAITPSWLSVLGTLIILSSALWVALSKKESKPRDAESGLSIDHHTGSSAPTRTFSNGNAAYTVLPTSDRMEGQSFAMTQAAVQGPHTASSLEVGNEGRGSRRASVASSKAGSESRSINGGMWGQVVQEESSMSDNKR